MSEAHRSALWAVTIAALLGAPAARAGDKVSIITSWIAEA